MKYLHEAVIIAAVTFAAEIIKFFVPLPVPASIYGLMSGTAYSRASISVSAAIFVLMGNLCFLSCKI